MTTRGKIVIFYSYKGGVGRSMALENIGVFLTEMGKKVLLVEWDLEAPGLEQYFQKLLKQEKQKAGGLLSLLLQAPNFETAYFEPLLTRIILDSGKELTLLDSGSDIPTYAEQLANLSWTDYFENRDGGEYLEQLRELWLS